MRNNKPYRGVQKERTQPGALWAPGDRPAPSEQLVDFANSFYECLNTPSSLACAILLNAGEYAQLVEKSVDPSAYVDSRVFRDDYAAVNLLRKFPHFCTGIDKRGVATKKFWESEDRCRETNRYLRSLRSGSDTSESASLVNRVLFTASRKILRVLGESPGTRWLDLAQFGPGATSHVTGSEVAFYNKYSADLGVSHRALHWAMVSIAQRPTWCSHLVGVDLDGPCVPLPGNFDLVEANKVTFVPKDAKTERPIAIEPHLNIFLQKGVGALMRERLLNRAGIDLRQHQRQNAVLARFGSITGGLATLDLSSASDTVSLELVRDLLPDDWFSLLFSLRSGYGELDGSVFKYEKFSSMGNGYTFELESLIFWALAQSVIDLEFEGEGVCFAYGDDLIVPSEAFDIVVNALQLLGFEVNTKKSFSTGYFRESCGRDYFDGDLVRPIFIKDEIDDVQRLLQTANAVRRLAHDRCSRSGCDRQLLKCYNLLVSWIPKSLRLRGPECLGDSVLTSNWDEASPRQARDGLEGWEIRKFVFVPFKRGFTSYKQALSHVLCAAPPDPASRQDKDPDSECNREDVFRDRMSSDTLTNVVRLTDSDDTSPTQGKYTLRGRGRYVIRRGPGFDSLRCIV